MTYYTYQEAQAFIRDLTPEQCDTIALTQGSMSIIVEYFTMPHALTLGRMIDGWTLFWIPIDRSPARWQLVLGSDTPRTHQLAEEGRIRRIQDEFSVSRQEAEQYVDAAKGVSFGFESTVIQMVLDRQWHRDMWESFPGPSAAIRFWLRGKPAYKDVPHNRIVTANRIIKSLWGEPEVMDEGCEVIRLFNERHTTQIPLPRNNSTLLTALGQ